MIRNLKAKAATLKTIAAKRVAPIAVAIMAAPAAFAQTADPFTTAVSDITTKIGTYGAALVGVSAVGVVFMVGMKYVKKIPRAA